MTIYWIDVTNKETGKKSTVHAIAKNLKHLRYIMRGTPFKITDYGQCSAASIVRLFADDPWFYCEVRRATGGSWVQYHKASQMRLDMATDNGNGRLQIIDF